MSIRYAGTVSWFDSETGLGSKLSDSGETISIDYRGIQSANLNTLKAEQRVTYVEVRDTEGLFATYLSLI